MPSLLQVVMKLVRTAAVLPPLSLPYNIQFFRPTAIPRRLRSASLLSISKSPSSQYPKEDTRNFLLSEQD